MADVDGNGMVNSIDVSLINGAIHGENLPGWWNHLTTTDQRNAWVNKVLTIDQTNKHPYRYWFQCGSFAEQLYIHGAFKRTDLFSTYYGEGQTIFNIPLYRVDVAGETYGHGINAILVGDDPPEGAKVALRERIVRHLHDSPQAHPLESMLPGERPRF